MATFNPGISSASDSHVAWSYGKSRHLTKYKTAPSRDVLWLMTRCTISHSGLTPYLQIKYSHQSIVNEENKLENVSVNTCRTFLRERFLAFLVQWLCCFWFFCIGCRLCPKVLLVLEVLPCRICGRRYGTLTDEIRPIAIQISSHNASTIDPPIWRRILFYVEVHLFWSFERGFRSISMSRFLRLYHKAEDTTINPYIIMCNQRLYNSIKWTTYTTTRTFPIAVWYFVKRWI